MINWKKEYINSNTLKNIEVEKISNYQLELSEFFVEYEEYDQEENCYTEILTFHYTILLRYWKNEMQKGWNLMSKEGWNEHTDKNGKEHADYYDKNPRESDHSSVHITFDSENEPHVM